MSDYELFAHDEISDARQLVGDVYREIIKVGLATADSLDDGVMPAGIQAYQLTFTSRDYAIHPERGQYVFFVDAGRCAISWGGDSEWMDSAGDVIADVRDWMGGTVNMSDYETMSTYETMTIDHMGRDATDADLAEFRDACERVLDRFGGDKLAATDYVWNNGDIRWEAQ